jgi:hypothetical protein
MTSKMAAILYRRHKTIIGKSNSLYRLLRKSKKFTLRNYYKPSNKNLKRNRKHYNKNVACKLYNNIYTKYKNRNKRKISIFSISIKRNAFNYKKTSALTKIKMMKFIQLLNKKTKNSILVSEVLKKTYNKKPRNLNSGLLLKNNNLTFGARAIPSFSRNSALLKTYYSALNKYKLYKDNNYVINVGQTVPLKIQNNKNFTSSVLTTVPAISKPILHISNIYKYLKIRQRFMLGLYKSNSLTALDKNNSGLYGLKKGVVNTSTGQNTLQKVNALYKLFTLYNDVLFYQDSALLRVTPGTLNNGKVTNVYLNKLSNLSVYSNKININTYKLLKKSNNSSKVQKLLQKPISRFISLYKGYKSSKNLSNYKSRLL